jgi:uncharacterized protein YjiS (DUF1127 family)
MSDLANAAYKLDGTPSIWLMSLCDAQDRDRQKIGLEINPRGLIRLKETIMTTITYGREAVRNQGVTFAPGLVGRVKGYWDRSRAVRQLNQLDDRMLADIGVRRADIARLVAGK